MSTHSFLQPLSTTPVVGRGNEIYEKLGRGGQIFKKSVYEIKREKVEEM